MKHCAFAFQASGQVVGGSSSGTPSSATTAVPLCLLFLSRRSRCMPVDISALQVWRHTLWQHPGLLPALQLLVLSPLVLPCCQCQTQCQTNRSRGHHQPSPSTARSPEITSNLSRAQTHNDCNHVLLVFVPLLPLPASPPGPVVAHMQVHPLSPPACTYSSEWCATNETQCQGV
jgi:hypothetical protein